MLQIRWSRFRYRHMQHAQEHHPKPLVCFMRTPPGILSGDMWKNVLEKIVEVNGVKGNILLGGAMFVLPTKKEVKLGTSASSA